MMKRALILATTTCLWTSACNTPNDMVVDMAPDLAPTTRYADIQADLKLLACTAVGCHNASAANKLRIDVTAGQERSNYDAMLAQGMLIPGSPNTSPLIVVPATGTAASGVSHVKTLTGTKLSNWTAWVQAGAPY